MHLRSLSLANFRNYAALELSLTPGVVLLLGENAQGKTNLLEAVFLLATGRADRAGVDAELIRLEAREDIQPVARVVGTVVRQGSEATVEVQVAGREGARGLTANKRYKLNGVAKRGSDVQGTLTAVPFTTDDMDLVRGAPAGRRRYLDVMLSQADPVYRRALQRYSKVVTQRNALLKQLQEGAGSRDEMTYWDEELAREGATLISGRAAASADLGRFARNSHRRLSGETELFEAAYAPRLDDGWDVERINSAEVAEVEAALREKYGSTRARDIAAGVTLSGPHRDDLTLTLDGEPAAAFASRGQQRTAALALRLAEAQLLASRTGEQPVLLLDDVLSELDASRRESVLGALEADQCWITSADSDRFPDEFCAGAQVFTIVEGTAERHG